MAAKHRFGMAAQYCFSPEFLATYMSRPSVEDYFHAPPLGPTYHITSLTTLPLECCFGDYQCCWEFAWVVNGVGEVFTFLCPR